MVPRIGKSGMDCIGSVHGLPVKPKYVPISPGERDNRKVPPTSGKKPRPTSGIASFVLFRHHAMAAWAESPTPPPITMPSMKAT